MKDKELRKLLGMHGKCFCELGDGEIPLMWKHIKAICKYLNVEVKREVIDTIRVYKKK